MNGRMKSVVGVAAVALFAGSAVLTVAAPASAHAQLVDSNPRNSSSVPTPPSVISLVFDELVSAPATVTVTGPNGRVDNTITEVVGDVVTVGVQLDRAIASPYAYEIAYRVVSADGHPVEGRIDFTYAPPGLATAQVRRPAVAHRSGRSTAPVVFVAGAIGLAAILVALIGLRRRP